jgi:hypothetical protein
MWKSIVKDFRNGVVDEEKIKKLQLDPYRGFELEKAVGVRPSVLTYHLKLDDSFLASVAGDISVSKNAGRRVGKEWMPKDTTAVLPKENEDDTWAGYQELKPLNDACTKWCTKKYFPGAFARVNMVANVIRLYDRLSQVNDYLNFKIVFKGGVMIRLVLLEFLNDLPLEARVDATKYLDNLHALSISDFDFEIVPRNHNSKPEEVHRFFLLDYAVLLWLQKQMQIEIEKKEKNKSLGSDEKAHKGLLSLEWDAEEGKRELKMYLQEAVDVAKGGSFKGATIDHVFLSDTPDPGSTPKGYKTKSGKPAPPPRKNVLIFDCDDTKCILHASKAFEELGIRGVPSRSGGSRLYSTLNTYIGETTDMDKNSRKGHLKGLFHLSRIKHSFIVYYTTQSGEKRCDRLGGEMIDLSQSHGVSRDLMKASMHNSVAMPYADYPILGVDPRHVVLHSYSMEGFLFDHSALIHHTEDHPWKVNKKEKRLGRYVAFLYAHVLGPRVMGSYAKKVNAFAKLSDNLSGLDSLLGSPPLRTGIQPIDAFAAKERNSLQHAPKREGQSYVRLIHRHIAAMCSYIRMPLSSNTVLDFNVYNNMHRFILS